MNQLAQLLSLFSDMPPDSAVGAKLKELVGAAVLEGKARTTFGNALIALVDAGRNPADTFYAKMEPQDAATTQATLNALRGALT